MSHIASMVMQGIEPQDKDFVFDGKPGDLYVISPVILSPEYTKEHCYPDTLSNTALIIEPTYPQDWLCSNVDITDDIPHIGFINQYGLMEYMDYANFIMWYVKAATLKGDK